MAGAMYNLANVLLKLPRISTISLYNDSIIATHGPTHNIYASDGDLLDVLTM